MPYSVKEFEQIYTRCVSPCLRTAISILGDEDSARDVVQDVFLKLWEMDFDIVNPAAFAFRAVRNACLDRIKSVDYRDRVRLELTIEPLPSDQDMDLRHEEVKSAIRTLLSQREQQVIINVYEYGCSYKETAETLGISVSMVNKCLVSALKKLRNHFKRDIR